MGHTRLPFGDPLAPEGNMNGRLKDIVEELVRMGITLKEASSEIEKLYIQAVLGACRGNRTQAARRLGIHRNTLNSKIEQHGLGDT